MLGEPASPKPFFTAATERPLTPMSKGSTRSCPPRPRTTPQQPYAQSPATEQKRSRFARHKILTGIGVLVLFSIIFGGANGSSSDTSSTSADSGHSSNNRGSSDTATSEETPPTTTRPTTTRPTWRSPPGERRLHPDTSTRRAGEPSLCHWA